MPTRTFPQVASAAIRRRPSDAESEAFRAISSAPELQAGDEGDEGHIPTLPFGTKAVAVSPPAPKDLRREKESGARFRFLLPTLPTSSRLESEQQFAATRPSWRGPARPDPLEPPSRIRLPLLLGASGVAILAFVLLLWPSDSDAPAHASPPRIPATAVPRVQQGSPGSATVGTHSAPGTPIGESPNAALAQAGTPAPRPQSSPHQNVPSPAPTAATDPGSPTSPRATVTKALTTLKGGSVLASVLAPPPAD